ncbi:hypothetical protein GS432_14065 [Rhodococcus hoagii]|nr:hypothetical protein [Prescottella equi]
MPRPLSRRASNFPCRARCGRRRWGRLRRTRRDPGRRHRFGRRAADSAAWPARREQHRLENIGPDNTGSFNLGWANTGSNNVGSANTGSEHRVREHGSGNVGRRTPARTSGPRTRVRSPTAPSNRHRVDRRGLARDRHAELTSGRRDPRAVTP